MVTHFHGRDGQYPAAGLVQDGSGNLYGTTPNSFHSKGLVFKIDTQGKETVLYSFEGNGPSDPNGGLVFDAAGNLYGTSFAGGDFGYGTVFKLSATGVLTVLHSFSGGRDGESPWGPLLMDGRGNLYGITYSGGSPLGGGSGIVFRVDATGRETVLYRFSGTDGAFPNNLVMGSSGNLYGTTIGGGLYSNGSVFDLMTNGSLRVLYDFQIEDGQYPTGLVLDQAGDLYGTMGRGGYYQAGNVFKLTLK